MKNHHDNFLQYQIVLGVAIKWEILKKYYTPEKLSHQKDILTCSTTTLKMSMKRNKLLIRATPTLQSRLQIMQRMQRLKSLQAVNSCKLKCLKYLGQQGIRQLIVQRIYPKILKISFRSNHIQWADQMVWVLNLLKIKHRWSDPTLT